MEKQTKGMRGTIIGLLVFSVLGAVTPAQAHSRHWDPSDSPRRLDIRRVNTYSCCPLWMKVSMYERWWGPGFDGRATGDFVLFDFDMKGDRGVDYRVRMRADADGRPRCDLFRGHERLRRLYAFGRDGGHSMFCDGYYVPTIDPQARWRVVAFDNHTITDRAPNHGWYRGI